MTARQLRQPNIVLELIGFLGSMLILLMWTLASVSASLLTFAVWHTSTGRSKRAAYRKWLKADFRERTRRFHGKNPLVLHIQGNDGYTAKSYMYLRPEQKPEPEFQQFRPAPIGSVYWRGFVRRQMKLARAEFIGKEVFPIAGKWNEYEGRR